jgi:transcription termination factor Rho
MAQPTTEGILELTPQGHGFLRLQQDFEPGPQDPFVPPGMVRRFALRAGDRVAGPTRPPRGSERSAALEAVVTVEGRPPEDARARPAFESLTALSPDVRMRLETGRESVAGRLLDLFAPVGKGQRGVIVAPPFAGKTSLLEAIGRSVAAGYPEVDLQLLLVDERPEEVTDLRRSGIGQVIASSFDSSPANHLRVAELALARAQRLVEWGGDVFILLDSLTRLTRAANLAITGSGRTLSGGLDPAALRFPRRFLGAARQVEGGGSLTILATALVDTGSRLDDQIFEEFKGTGNWELRLDRKLAERRIFPAVDLDASGTRREELLVPAEELAAAHRIRRYLHRFSPDRMARTERLLQLIERTENNERLLELARPKPT